MAGTSGRLYITLAGGGGVGGLRRPLSTQSGMLGRSQSRLPRQAVPSHPLCPSFCFRKAGPAKGEAALPTLGHSSATPRTRPLSPPAPVSGQAACPGDAGHFLRPTRSFGLFIKVVKVEGCSPWACYASCRSSTALLGLTVLRGWRQALIEWHRCVSTNVGCGEGAAGGGQPGDAPWRRTGR